MSAASAQMPSNRQHRNCNQSNIVDPGPIARELDRTQKKLYFSNTFWADVNINCFAVDSTKGSRFDLFVLIAVMWWWIFWHLWHDFDHIVGEFPYPKPELWTNEELGIPPDDEDD